MLGPQINLFQGTFKITLDRQWNLSTSVAMSLLLEKKDIFLFDLFSLSLSAWIKQTMPIKFLALLIPLKSSLLSKILGKTKHSGNKV